MKEKRVYVYDANGEHMPEKDFIMVICDKI